MKNSKYLTERLNKLTPIDDVFHIPRCSYKNTVCVIDFETKLIIGIYGVNDITIGVYKINKGNCSKDGIIGIIKGFIRCIRKAEEEYPTDNSMNMVLIYNYAINHGMEVVK